MSDRPAPDPWVGHLPAPAPLVVEALVVVGALMASLPSLVGDRQGVGGVGGWDVAVVLAGTLPLLLRRRAPLLVFGWVALLFFVTAVSGPGPYAGAAVLVAMYTVAASCARRQLVAAAAALEVGVVFAVLRVATGAHWLPGIVFGTGLVAAAVAAGLYAATRRDYLEQLQERAVRLERERVQEIALSAAAERGRLAREMHDIVAHHLTVMVALSEGAVASAAASPERALEAMRAVSATGRRALSDTRGLLGVLREDAPGGAGPAEPVPALAELDALVRRVREAGLPVTVEVTGAAGDLPAGVQLTVYRLVQEALTNTLKHAGSGASATVRLGFSDDEVRVDVEDDGSGASAAGGSGRGLTGMRERVQAFGGDVRAGPRAPYGWHVSARLVVDPEPAA